MIKRFLILGAVVLVITAIALNQASAASPQAGQNSQVTLEKLEIHQADVQAELYLTRSQIALFERVENAR